MSSRQTSAPESRAAADDLVAATDLGDDVEVGLEVEQRGEGAADEGLVVGQQQPDHGSTTCTRVPGAPERLEGAAGAGTRSRMPRRPLPSAAGATRRRRR